MAETDPFAGWDAAPATDPFAGWDATPEPDPNVLWAGRPTTLSEIRRVAELNKVSPQTIMELGTPAGRAEAALSQTAAGNIVIRAGEGIKALGENIGASVARAAGRDDISRRIHDDRRQREQFLQFIEKGGDLNSALGDRGSRIFNQTVQSVAQTGTSAYLAGPVGIYADTIGSSWEQGLDEAQRLGFGGLDSVAHAGRKAVIEGGFTFLMGRIPGVTTLEESFSPAARNAVKSLTEQPATQGVMAKLVKELGGWTAEGVEEMMIAGGHQVNEIAGGFRDDFAWDEILEAGASGVSGRGAVGAIKSFHGEMKKIKERLPDVAKGVRAAEIDLERGINPLEVKDIKDNAELERQTGHKFASKESADSYRSALDFYVQEARERGETGSLQKMEQDVAKLREEERQQALRISESKAKAKLNKGKAGESTTKLEPVVEQPIKTANERAEFSLNDFMDRTSPPVDSTLVNPAPTNVNPYLLAPWESETRQQKRIRVLSRTVAEYKDKLAALRETNTAKRRLREDQLKSAQELIQENIPREEQYKFLNRIRTAKGPKAVDKLLDAVGQHIDRRDHNLALIGLKQSLRKAVGLRKEFAGLVGDVKNGVDLSRFTGRDAAIKLREYANQNPNALLSEKDKANLARLEEKKNVADMSAQEIRDLSVYIQDLAYQSAIKDRLILNQQSAHVRDVGDVIASETTNALQREMRSDSSFAKIKSVYQSKTQSEVNKSERTVASQLLYEAAERPEVTLEKLSPTLRKAVYDDIAIDGQEVYDTANRDTTEGLASVFDAVGLGHQDSLEASLKRAVGSKDATPLESWRNQERVIGGVTMTRGEAFMIRRWLQDTNRAAVLQKAGVKLEEGNRVVPPLTPKLIAEVYDFVGEQGNTIANWMFEHDNTVLIDGVNAVNEQLTGRALTDKRDVVPSRVASDDGFAKFMSNGRGLSAGFGEALVDSYGSLQHREDTGNPLLIPSGMDGIDMFMNHADRMHRFTAFAVPARNAELLLNDSEVKNAITSKSGRQGYEHIVNAVKVHVVGNPATGNVGRALGWWNSGVAASHIAGKLSVMMMQPMDILSTLPYEDNGLADLRSGMAELNARGIDKVEAEMEQVLGAFSGNYWKRYKSDDFAGEHTSGQFRRSSFFRPSSIAQHALRPTARVEQLAAALPHYLSAKASARRAFGMADNDYTVVEDNPEWGKLIARNWDRKIYRGSNSSNGLELSGALRYAKENPVAGLVTNFYNTAGKVYSLLTMGVDQGRMGNKRKAAEFIGAGLVGTAMVSAIQQALSFSKDDDELTYFQATAQRAAANLVGLHPVGGGIIQNEVLPRLFGMRQYSDNPVLVYDTAQKAVGAATDVILMLADQSGEQLDPDKFNRAMTTAAISTLSALRLPAPGLYDLGRRVVNTNFFPGVEGSGEEKAGNDYVSLPTSF